MKKKLYVQVIKEELGSTSTYILFSAGERDILDSHIQFMAKIGISPDKVHESLPSMYWLPKLHKTPYKARFIANSSSCSTTPLSKLLTSGLQLIKNGIIKYSEKVSENTGKNVFWSVKNSGEVLQ